MIAATRSRHLRILLLATLVLQGLLFISYPIGGVNNDDNQAAQAYLMDELLQGNLLIGNLRYNTGYPFVMAPVKALTDALEGWLGQGELGDRLFLLVQMAVYSSIPFLVYDMMWRRFSAGKALIGALVVLLDPFGLQWTHFYLPEWLIATALVWALWLAQLAWSASPTRRKLLVALAALVLGIMTFTRFNCVPVVAVYGASFLLWRHIPLRQRLSLFAIVGGTSGAVLAAYIAFIHIPSTGVATLSCVSDSTWLASFGVKGLRLHMSQGPASEKYAQYLSLRAPQDPGFTANHYTKWRIPGPWVSPAQAQAFLSQPFGEVNPEIRITFPQDMYWYMGPCPSSALLADVTREAIAAQPGTYLAAVARDSLTMLLQDPEHLVFRIQHLDRPEELVPLGENTLGFQRVTSALYSGQRVWLPGIQLYSALFLPLHSIKWLMPFALLAALWRRDWLLLTAAAMLLSGILVIAFVASAEPRYISMLAPLYTLLLGWFLSEILEQGAAAFKRRQTRQN